MAAVQFFKQLIVDTILKVRRL